MTGGENYNFEITGSTLPVRLLNLVSARMSRAYLGLMLLRGWALGAGRFLLDHFLSMCLEIQAWLIDALSSSRLTTLWVSKSRS